jgi:hypothetical protein
MNVKGIVYEDFVNYKKPNMFIATSKCSFKCDKEAGSSICQNSTLAVQRTIYINDNTIVETYIQNPITEAIVFGGLEPFDTQEELLHLIDKFRKYTNDTIIIYTGYTEKEYYEMNISNILPQYNNIIVKFGRYIPNNNSHYDSILGIYLASDNQYAKVIS